METMKILGNQKATLLVEFFLEKLLLSGFCCALFYSILYFCFCLIVISRILQLRNVVN